MKFTLRQGLDLARLRRRLKRVPRQAYPTALERAYTRELLAVTSLCETEIRKALSPLFASARRADALTDRLPEDELPREPSALIASLGDALAVIARTVTHVRARLTAQGVGRRVSDFVRVAVGQQIQALTAIPLTSVLAASPAAAQQQIDQFVATNVDLITSIPEQLFAQVREAVQRAAAEGQTAKQLAGEVEARFGVSRSRARLIARDQVGKLQGNLTQVRHRELGVTGYIWRTNRDERVRDTHKVLEGQRFDWVAPPDVGHPGQDYQCRCRAEPDLRGALGGALDF